MATKVFVFGILAALAGTTILVVGFLAHREDAELASWPTVEGEVLSSNMGITTRRRLVWGSRSLRPNPTGVENKGWGVTVEYRYSFNGETYDGYAATSRVLFEEIESDRTEPSDHLRNFHKQLKPGTKIPVHYNPADPAACYIFHISSPRKPGLFTSGTIALVIGIILIGLAKFGLSK